MFISIGSMQLRENPLYKRRNSFLFVRFGWKLFIKFHQEIYANKRIKITKKLIARLKIKKYFLSAGVSGALISRCIHGDSKIAKARRVDYSILFSYWAVLLIALDSYSDLEHIDKQRAISANLKIAGVIIERMIRQNILIPEIKLNSFYKWLNSYDADLLSNEDSSMMSFITYFTEKFSDSMISCLKHEESEEIVAQNTLQIIDALMKLMNAQINSLNQSVCSEIYDWDWYSTNVLRSKFDYIFISVLKIFPQNEIQARRINYLLEGIEAVNEIYLHRQILDDLIDFEEDIDNEIFATPSYILMAYDLNKMNSNKEIFVSEILEKIKASGKYTKGDFIKSWNVKNFRLCKALIRQSGILKYFVEVIENEKRTMEISKKISDVMDECPEIRDCILIYFSRAVKSFKNFKKKYSI